LPEPGHKKSLARWRSLHHYALVALSLCCGLALAQGPARQVTPALENTSKSLHIRKVPHAGMKVDGRLDEPVWSQITPVRDFVQLEPDLGTPVSEKTEAMVFYDDENLYIGFRCFDRQPHKIIAKYGPHDSSFDGSDAVRVLLDPFHDRRTGFVFLVNPLGIQADATINEEVRSGDDLLDLTWDAIWYSAAAIEDWGWSAEIQIPFRSIRVSSKDAQTWGFNFGRGIFRKNERAYWQPVTRYDGQMKPSKAGLLSIIENIQSGKNLELIPYFSDRYRFHAPFNAYNGDIANAGLDVRYGVTPNLTANFAVNPDFADTEADQFSTTLSRFEVFFPEKRKFFTEGADYYSTPLSLFFSRRIGARLPNGEPQRILEGGKLTGKTGPWTLGFLQALTQRTAFLDPDTGAEAVAPAAWFGVARVQRNIFKKSAIGFIYSTRRQPPGDIGSTESAYGMDLQVLKGEHINWTSQAFANTNDLNPGFTDQNLGWQSNYTYDSEKYTFTALGKYLGDRVDLSQLGFEPEIGRYSGDLDFVYKPFINRWGIRQVFIEPNYDQATGVGGELEDSGADLFVRAQLKNFWTVRVGYSYDRIRFNDFTPQFGLLSTTRIYQNPKWRFEVGSNQNRPVFFDLLYTSGKTVQFDERFHAFERRFDLTATARLGRRLRTDLTAVDIDEQIAGGPHFQTRHFLISRVNYQFTQKFWTRVLAQYADDRRSSDLNVNSLVAYDFTARSAFYVGLNRQRNSPRQPFDLGNEVFVKLSYLFEY
jgi:hypothetical protein